MIYKWIRRIVDVGSKMAAMGIFILALFGYFYTVKPKFFLDNLKIKTSILEDKNVKLNEDIREKEKRILNIEKEKEKTLLSIKNEIKLKQEEITLLKEDKVKILLNLEEKINIYKNILAKQEIDIDNLSIQNDKNINKKKYILWEIFLKKIYIRTVSNAKAYTKKSEYFIKDTEQDKKILRSDAPYKVVKKYFMDLKYSSKYKLIDKNLFDEFRNMIIDDIDSNKVNLKYTVPKSRLQKLQKEYNSKIAKFKFMLKSNDYEKQDIARNKIHKLYQAYDKTVKKCYVSVEKKINQFINRISTQYIKTLNLDKKSKIYIKFDKREYEYGSFITTLRF